MHTIIIFSDRQCKALLYDKGTTYN